MSYTDISLHQHLNYNFFTDPPEKTKITLKRNTDKSVTVTCSAEGEPTPEYEIFFNDTKLPARGNTYEIPEVTNNTVGYYKCVATNILGNDSSSPKYLSPSGKPFIFLGCTSTD